MRSIFHVKHFFFSLALIALALFGLVSRAEAQAQRVGICLESVNPSTGANQCNDGWAPIILNGLQTNAVAIKTSQGLLGRLYCYNPNASVAYVQVYNASVATTETALQAGTQSPTQSYGIAQTSGQNLALPTSGDWYGTAITISTATTATGNTAVGTAVDCNASYE